MARDHDSTNPPNRTTQQREHRVRREQYVTDLEHRIRRTERENNQLRGELAATQANRTAASPPFDAQTAHASSELMQSLSVASASLARYHQLAFVERRDSRGAHQPPPGPPHSSSLHQPPQAASTSRSTQPPSSAPPPRVTPTESAVSSRSYGGKRPHGEDSPAPGGGQSGDVSKRDYKDNSKDGSGSSNSQNTVSGTR